MSDLTYEQGYRNGESSVAADYDFWFKDELHLPDRWSASECKAFVESIVERYVDWDLLPERYPRLVDEPAMVRNTDQWQAACGDAFCGLRMYASTPQKVLARFADHLVLNGHTGVILTQVRP